MSISHLRRAVLLLAFACAGGAQAQGLVILVRGPVAAAHPVGSALAPGTVLALGDRIDVLERGGTRRLDGPTVYVALQRSTAADNVRLVVSQLMDRRREVQSGGAMRGPSEPRVRGGAVPAAGGPADPARFAGGLWSVDAARAGATCILPGVAPRLWRPAGASADAGTLAPATDADGAPVRFGWAAGAEGAAWPASLPSSPRDYLVGRADGAATRVRLVPLAQPATLDDLVVALDAAGCGAQLGYLLDRYPRTPAAAR